VETGADLMEWAAQASGKGLGLAPERRVIRPVLLDTSFLIALKRLGDRYLRFA
jgi:hypothetical protein